MLEFLRQEGIPEELIDKVIKYRTKYCLSENDLSRIPTPSFFYYGKEVWISAITALISGENILLVGPKATGKNVLAENLACLFNRPLWDISFYLNTDSSILLGSDTFKNGEVTLRKGPIYQCSEAGGFGILDEINMAKNESLAVLHATLDYRRIIDLPGYDRIKIHPATRFIATMNYGYAGTRELNEALASRFMVINMPIITQDNLAKLLLQQNPDMKSTYIEQFAMLFDDIQNKCNSSEISSKALDLRGLLGACKLMKNGLPPYQALCLGLVNKSFDSYEHQLISDVISTRISGNLTKEDIFG